MKTEQDYLNLLSEIKNEFSDFKVIDKTESKLMKTIDTLLRVITFGAMKEFLTRFTTTLGNTVYVPGTWPSYSVESKLIILRHERVHMRQARRYTRPLFSFLYLFFPLPVLFAYCRRSFEAEAYEESLAAMAEYFGPKMLLSNEKVKASMLAHFTSAEYFWMWVEKGSLNNWYDSTVAKLQNPEGDK